MPEFAKKANKRVINTGRDDAEDYITRDTLGTFTWIPQSFCTLLGAELQMANEPDSYHFADIGSAPTKEPVHLLPMRLLLTHGLETTPF